MNSLKSKKKKIILSISAGVFILSTITVASLYAKYNNDKTEIIKDPKTGLTKQEEQKVRRYDPNKDEEYELLRKYLIKVIKVLQKGTKNAQQKLDLKDHQIGIAYLEEAINFGKSASLIVARAIEISQKNERKIELREDRDTLNTVLKDAIKALEVLKAELRRIIQHQALVNQTIKNIESALKRADEAVTIPEFNFLIAELEKINSESRPIEAKARELLLTEEANKLVDLLDALVLKINDLKSKVNNQTLEQQKESVRLFVAGLPEKISRVQEKSKNAVAAVDIEEALKEVKFLIESSNGVKDLAVKLGLNEEAAKIIEYLRTLEDEKTNLEKRLEEKAKSNKVLQTETEAVIKEIQNKINESNNPKTIEDLDNSISKIEEILKKSEDLKFKLEVEKLSNKINEIRDAISNAKQRLEDIKNQKRDIEDQIQTEKENIGKIVGNLQTDYQNADVESKKAAGNTSALRKIKSMLQISEATYNRLNADSNTFVKPRITSELESLKNKIDDIKGKIADVEANYARNQKDVSQIYVDKILGTPNNIYFGNEKLTDASTLRKSLASNVEKIKNQISLKNDGELVDLDTKVEIETDYNDYEGKLFVKVKADRFGVKKETIWMFEGYKKFNDYFEKNKGNILNISYTGQKTLKEKIKDEYGGSIENFVEAIKKNPNHDRWDFLRKQGFSYKLNLVDSSKLIFYNLLINDVTAGENSFIVTFTPIVVLRNASNTTFGNSNALLSLPLGENKPGQTTIVVK
ncbi:hypothetical protein DA803_01485 [[Mycoplasma] phocae]|uniref:Uncharacterized protein n=1 Tax=[Mycoplasma] phocae TaxID=142651 RepID=A0A2Z5IQB6_9BACT|nr:hypothetical protein [[Mycoplasma] phocae]AXE60757.1 hypothetical protein DA803_01485 [[Mycoplasma] phocae]